MIICDFCLLYTEDGKCWVGLKIPKHMGCRGFAPSLKNFCSNPDDFVSAGQLVQMASFFGIKGMEMRKVMAMAALAEETRSKAPADQTSPSTINKS
jgi:hypothetical protein